MDKVVRLRSFPKPRTRIPVLEGAVAVAVAVAMTAEVVKAKSR
jgi:hypothetical protein